MAVAFADALVLMLCCALQASPHAATRLYQTPDAVSFLQMHATATSILEPNFTSFASSETQSCSNLENHGSYFSVILQAGTPPQTFDVVADTGSDAVIIPSCLCKEAGSCTPEDRCFVGSGKSSTFRLNTQNNEVPLMDMEFGSGSIKAAVTTDVVTVGSRSATMQEGLLLMVDRHLDIVGSFEGILGLGQLQSEYTSGISGDASVMNADVDDIHANWDKPQDGISSNMFGGGRIAVPGFLRNANVDRFSVCFNDGESPGVLRLGTPEQPRGVPSVGTLHWGLEMRGFSVGTHQLSSVLFCNSGTEEDACGVIPDSGTTVMLGPDAQLRSLFADICDKWPRCKTAAQNEYKDRAQEDAFQMVLARCEEWLEEGDGLEELPSLYLHLGNAENNKTLELSAWSYVFESLVDDMEPHTKLLGSVGVSFASLMERTSTKVTNKERYACAPAFGTSEYASPSKGPVWIVGTPLFYEYIVGYDRSSTPPMITFSAEPCGACAQQNSTTSEHQENQRVILSQAQASSEADEKVETDKQLRRSMEVTRHKPRRIKRAPRVGHHWRSKHRSRM